MLFAIRYHCFQTLSVDRAMAFMWTHIQIFRSTFTSKSILHWKPWVYTDLFNFMQHHTSFILFFSFHICTSFFQRWISTISSSFIYLLILSITLYVPTSHLCSSFLIWANAVSSQPRFLHPTLALPWGYPHHTQSPLPHYISSCTPPTFPKMWNTRRPMCILELGPLVHCGPATLLPFNDGLHPL